MHTVVQTSLGELTLVASGGFLTGVYFPHHWHRPSPSLFGEYVESDPVLDRAARQLSEYLAGDRETFDVPVRADGDEFQHRVWDLIADIPYGRTTTYGDLARALGPEVQARDVGAAVGQNPLSIVVPCHRVVGKNGSLTGYAGGLRRKQTLLELESALLPLA
jgi:methylated-DNA-[protein]-cysteine S-methyltransferase